MQAKQIRNHCQSHGRVRWREADECPEENPQSPSHRCINDRDDAMVERALSFIFAFPRPASALQSSPSRTDQQPLRPPSFSHVQWRASPHCTTRGKRLHRAPLSCLPSRRIRTLTINLHSIAACAWWLLKGFVVCGNAEEGPLIPPSSPYASIAPQSIPCFPTPPMHPGSKQVFRRR